MDFSLAPHLAQTPDLAHRLRRLSFFDGHFRRQMEALGNRHGLAVAFDAVRLTRAFLAWGEDFASQRAAAAIDRRDYIVFTAGILLNRLLEAEPVTVSRVSGQTAPAGMEFVAFWPEGFLYTAYCLNVLQAVLQQESVGGLAINGLQDNLRIWWSFRENVGEDLATAVGFFDLFAGSQPNWQFPRIAAERPAIRRARPSSGSLCPTEVLSRY